MTAFVARKQQAQAITGYPCTSWDHAVMLGPGASGGESTL